jgi:hypothetical protein
MKPVKSNLHYQHIQILKLLNPSLFCTLEASLKNGKIDATAWNWSRVTEVLSGLSVRLPSLATHG